MRSKSRLAAEGLLVLATLIWGGTFAATRAGLEFVSPLLLIAIRFLASALILIPLYSLAGRNWWRHAAIGTVLGVVVAGGYVLQTVGLQFTSAARSGFLTYMFAVLIPPFQRMFTKHRLSPANLVGLAIVIAGSLLMTRPWQASGWNAGDLITLGSAVSFAFFIVLVDRFAGTIETIDLVPSQFLVAGVIALAGTFFLEDTVLVWNGTSVWTILYLTLAGTVGALGLQTVFQPRTTPVRATTIYALEPVFAAVFGFVLLGERLSGLEVLGAAVILAGVLYSQLRQPRIE